MIAAGEGNGSANGNANDHVESKFFWLEAARISQVALLRSSSFASSSSSFRVARSKGMHIQEHLLAGQIYGFG